MFAAEYVEIAENNARDIRRPVSIPAFTLKTILKLNSVVTLFQHKYNIAMTELTFLLLFLVLPLDDFLCATLTVELLTVTDADFFPEVTCSSSSATLTNG